MTERRGHARIRDERIEGGLLAAGATLLDPQITLQDAGAKMMALAILVSAAEQLAEDLTVERRNGAAEAQEARSATGQSERSQTRIL